MNLRRTLFNGLVLASALLCAASTAFWVRGYYGADYLFWSQRISTNGWSGQEVDVKLCRGGIRFSDAKRVYNDFILQGRFYHFYAADSSAYPFLGRNVGPMEKSTEIKLLGFQYVTQRPAANFSLWSLTMPLGFFTVTFGILPTRWMQRRFVRGRTARRAMKNQCLGCGYDLRASPIRCPECGRCHKGWSSDHSRPADPH